jgi:hypothetical protein
MHLVGNIVLGIVAISIFTAMGLSIVSLSSRVNDHEEMLLCLGDIECGKKSEKQA